MLLDKISVLEGELKKEKHGCNYMENVEISGIPMTWGESCKQLVYNLGINPFGAGGFFLEDH